MTGPLPRVELAGDRALALTVAAHARDAADARLLLEALGLVAPVRGFVRPRLIPAHTRHGRSPGIYVPGCPHCAAINARYVDRWRRRGGGPAYRPTAVTSGGVLLPVETLQRPTGRGHHRAWPGQLALVVDGEAS